MKLTKTQLKRIIKEELEEGGFAAEVDDHDRVRDDLKSAALAIRSSGGPDLDSDGDGLADAGTVKMLLQRYFDNNFGAKFNIGDFSEEIDQYAAGVGLNEGKKLKITKAKLKQIIKEELGKVMGGENRESIYLAAELSPEEAITAETAISDPDAFASFINTSAHEKLYNYFSDAGEIPYEIDSQSMSAGRTPDEWIVDHLSELPVQ
jgi:hypothetical protein